MYVDAIAVARHGCWPVGLGTMYDRDDEHLRLYAAASRDDEAFDQYLQGYVMNGPVTEEAPDDTQRASA